MTEVMAYAMGTKSGKEDSKDKLEEKLSKAFKQFVDGGALYSEGGRAFFISSKFHKSTDLNAYLLRAIAQFNEHAA